jgi:dipeptidyl aminopeptidase/acylaminoacyl peptidase
MQTATPTPVFITVEPFASPTPTATPTATPQPIPAVLLGKIIFLSDREGATEEDRLEAEKKQATPQITPQPYAFDPATGQLARLTDIGPYEVAVAREAWSADRSYRAYTTGPPDQKKKLAVFYFDYRNQVEYPLTRMGAGIAYDAAWSPVSDEVAFVSTESRNDEIWVINRDGTNVRQLTRNEWEWDKHPSWSPDGQQIVFFSNRTGNNQIWIMNKDGSEQRLLMESNPYNDWDPVWVKYVDPAIPSATRTPASSIFTTTLTLLNPVTLDPPSYGPTDFEWRWTGPVPAGFGFEVRVWREGEQPVGVHNAVLDNQNGKIKRIDENTYRLSVDIKGTVGVLNQSGDYLWTVALVRISPNYADSGQQAPPAHFRFAGG